MDWCRPGWSLILHLDGPVSVRRGQFWLGTPRRVLPGGLFLHPAAHDLTVELGGDLRTTHVYLTDEAVQEAADGQGRVDLAEKTGRWDRLIEQVVLGLDGVLRGWEPARADLRRPPVGAARGAARTTRRPAGRAAGRALAGVSSRPRAR